MKKFGFSLLTAMALGVASSHATVYILSGAMDPFQATTNSGNSGSGSGTISGSYDDVANILNWAVTWQNLTANVTVAHFHVGAPGSTGTNRVTISGAAPATGSNSGTNTITVTDETNLLGGNWYANIHTGNFPGGEIRGQVNVAPIPEPGTSALALGALGLLFLRRRR